MERGREGESERGRERREIGHKYAERASGEMGKRKIAREKERE